MSSSTLSLNACIEDTQYHDASSLQNFSLASKRCPAAPALAFIPPLNAPQICFIGAFVAFTGGGEHDAQQEGSLPSSAQCLVDKRPPQVVFLVSQT